MEINAREYHQFNFFSLYRKPRLYHTPAILLLLALITSPCALGGSDSDKPTRPRSDMPIATKKYDPSYIAAMLALFNSDQQHNHSDLTKKMSQKIQKVVEKRVRQSYALIIDEELKKRGCKFNKETGQIEEIGQKVEKRNKEIDKKKNKSSPMLSPSAPWFSKNKKTKPCSPSSQQGAYLTAPTVGLDSGNCLCFFAAGTVALCAALGKEGIDQLAQQLPEDPPPFLAPQNSIRNSLINSLNELKEAFFCHDENKTKNDRQQQADNAANNIREQLMEYQQNHTKVKKSNALFSKANQRQQDPAEYLNLLLELIGDRRGSSFQFNETDTTESYVPDFLEMFLTGPQSKDTKTLGFAECKTTTKNMLIVNVNPEDSLQRSLDAYLDISLNDTTEEFNPSVLKKQLQDNKEISFLPNERTNPVRDIFTTNDNERLNALNTLDGRYKVTTHNTRQLLARLTSNEGNPPTQFKTLIIQHSLSIENTGNNGQYGARKMDEKELKNNNSVSDNTLIITFYDTKTKDYYIVTFTRTAICAHTGSDLNSGHYVALIKDTSESMPYFIKYDGHTISNSKTLLSHMEEGIGDICISFYTVERIQKCI